MRYEYRCPANDTVLEVEHSMTETLRTWSELCERAGIPTGETEPSAPVERVISGGTLALPRRVSKEGPKSDYDPVLHGGDSCVPCGCAATDTKTKFSK